MISRGSCTVVRAVCGGGQIDIPGLRLLGACKANILNQRVRFDPRCEAAGYSLFSGVNNTGLADKT
jgi:hypothetical protein